MNAERPSAVLAEAGKMLESPELTQSSWKKSWV